MAFREESEDAFTAIKELCKERGLKWCRTDQDPTTNRVYQRIVSGIQRTAFVIADVTLATWDKGDRKRIVPATHGTGHGEAFALSNPNVKRHEKQYSAPGRPSGQGTVFKVRVVLSLLPAQLQLCFGRLLSTWSIDRRQEWNLYGTANVGGPLRFGTVWQITP
jgi:hypothetical protein